MMKDGSSINLQPKGQPQIRRSSIPDEERMVELYIEHRGDLGKVKSYFRNKPMPIIQKQFRTLFIAAMRRLQRAVESKNLRIMFVKWTSSELQHFVPRFLMIRNGVLKGFQKTLTFSLFAKLLQSKYTSGITLTNRQFSKLYEQCHDISLGAEESRTKKNSRAYKPFQRIRWSKEELETLADFILKHQDLDLIALMMMKRFGSNQKYTRGRIYQKIDTLMRLSMRKIRRFCDIHRINKMIPSMDYQEMKQLNHSDEALYEKTRQFLLQYILESEPSAELTEGMVRHMNNFISRVRQEEVYEINKSEIKIQNTYKVVPTNIQQIVPNYNQFTQQPVAQYNIPAQLTEQQIEQVMKEVSGMDQEEFLRQCAQLDLKGVESGTMQIRR